MPKEYSREQLWKLYLKLPEELKEMANSPETSDTIEEICKKNEIEEKKEEITKYIGYILFGLLPPNEFQEKLEKELNLDSEKAKKVSREIERFIFYPVKAALEELYKIEIAPPARPTGITPPPEEKPPKVERDIYREPIE